MTNRAWRPWWGAASWAVAVALVGEPVAAQDVRYNGSLSYSAGSYVFVERMHSFWLGNGLAAQVGPATLSASLPLILQNNGVVSFVAGAPIPTGGNDNKAVDSRSAGRIPSRGSGGPSGGQGGASDSTVVFRDDYEVEIGDPLMFASLEVLSGGGLVRSVAVQASVKAPVRTLESGVGTGQWDFGGGGSLALGSGRTLLFTDLTLWSFGDLPDLELETSLFYSFAASRAVMDARGSIMASLSGATTIAESVDAPLAAGLSFLYLVGERRSLSCGVAVGLSEGSPDLSAYLGWSLGL